MADAELSALADSLNDHTGLERPKDMRPGDIVFFYADGKEEDRPQAGYAVLMDAEHYLTFDPYDANAKPRTTPLPEEAYLWYHGTAALAPEHLGLEDTISILWSVHRRASANVSKRKLLENEVQNPQVGEVILQERLDGYLSLARYGNDLPYEDAPEKKHWWSSKPNLIQRPYTTRMLLRTPQFA